MALRKRHTPTGAEVPRKLGILYKNYYEKYRTSVLEGERKAGMLEFAKIQRQDDDLKNGVDGYIFDMDLGVRPLVWMALNLKFPTGDAKIIGKPLIVQPWQAYDIICLFGWVEKEDRTKRRFIDAFWEIARKNGKSTLVGALLDYLAFGGENPAARCYIGATSLEQAEEVFSAAAGCIELAKGDAVRVGNSKNNKQINYGRAMIRAIAAEPKDGKLAYGAVIDEYHQHKSNDLLESIHSGNVTTQNSTLIRITTAGTDMAGVCHEEYEKCKAVLDGTNDIPNYFVSIYEPDPGDDPAEVDTWEKANPNLGVSVDEKGLRAQYNYAAGSASDFVAFKTKNLNLWCHGLSKWANMPVWLRECHWEYDADKLVGATCTGGLDLAASSDFTAFTLDFPIPGTITKTDENGEEYTEEVTKHVQLSHFWIPEAKRDEIARACRIPMDKWIEEGYITATPGEVIDYKFVADYIEDCYEKYNLLFVAVDKWNISALLAVMPDWFTEIAFEFSQGLKSMSPTIKEFERAYLTGCVTANLNPVIDWMMSCADVLPDQNDNIRLVKPKRRTSARIDGIITSIMALNTASTHCIEDIDVDVSSMVSFF